MDIIVLLHNLSNCIAYICIHCIEQDSVTEIVIVLHQLHFSSNINANWINEGPCKALSEEVLTHLSFFQAKGINDTTYNSSVLPNTLFPQLLCAKVFKYYHL